MAMINRLNVLLAQCVFDKGECWTLVLDGVIFLIAS